MKVSLILIIVALVALFFLFKKTPATKSCGCNKESSVYLDDPATNLDQPVQYSEFLNPAHGGPLV
jgi:hypothetical protein